MSDYLDEALRACRLPISVEYDLYDRGRLGAWQIEHPYRATWPYTWQHRETTDYAARLYYLSLRNRLLAEQKENE